MKRDDVYYHAMKTRDHRFDGKFFIGVKTTGIYCRPICPAKPKRENVEFFESAIAAEKVGYRPCLRCRPESAPFSPAWIGKSAIVQRALKVLHSHEAIEFDENTFAARFGVSARHLRRLFVEEIGKTPKQLAFDNRLNLARKLIVESNLSITSIAFASGFLSVRRFNDAFKDRFKKAPKDIRRTRVECSSGVSLYLSYRPPYDYEGLYQSYKNHRVGNLESFEDGKYTRIAFVGKTLAQVSVSHRPEMNALQLDIETQDPTIIYTIISNVRSMFDLHSDPAVIANSLEKQTNIKKLLKKFPGIRLPSGWDPFEVAVGTILGQLVSVDRGRALLGELIEIAGRDVKWKGQSIKLFPTAQDILDADLTPLKTTGRRRETLKTFARACVSRQLHLEATQDANVFMEQALKVRGIGPWTANYMALKALRHTDAFPGSDLILAREFKKYSSGNMDEMSPWKGYVAALLWRSTMKGERESK